MSDCDPQREVTPKQSFGMYAVWSMVSLLGLFLLPIFWHSPHHARGYFSFGALVLVGGVASVCILAFIRCPFHHWFVKLLTSLSLLVALFYVGLIAWIYFFKQ